MTAYELLSEPIRRYVKDQKWEAFTPVQTAAIVKIMTTEGNYILASRTASGKTEAAFLPILSKVDFNEVGVQVMYISPLIALINDQLERVEDLCKYLDVTVTKWHGEANPALKKKLLDSPNGVILITPESLEAMFQNKPNDVKRLFASLKFVVIDEIHYFIGNERGVHLQSLLHRLSKINKNRFRFIGLSATIGDYSQAKCFLGKENEAGVLLDKTPKECKIGIRYFPIERGCYEELPLDLLKEIYKATCKKRVLIFANSRFLVEEIAVKLAKISERVGGHSNYFAYHSSVDKNLKESAAFFAKHSHSEPFTICCTSTLELGIDIGNMDLVVQIDSPNKVSTMVQRMGRSGRTQNSISELLMFPTNEWSLLQSLACWKLHEKGKMEKPEKMDRPYDVLVQQMLSVVKERTEIAPSELIREMRENVAFRNCDTDSMKLIIKELIKSEMLEEIGGNLIVGLKAEQYFSMGEFYTVFWSKYEYEVLYHGDVIGSLSPAFVSGIGQRLYLAGGVWEIVEIDDEKERIMVDVSSSGKAPIYWSEKCGDSYQVNKEILTILYETEEYSVLDETGKNKLKDLRKKYADNNRIGVLNIPFVINNNQLVTFFPYCGNRVGKTIWWLFNLCHHHVFADDYRIKYQGGIDDFQKAIKNIVTNKVNYEELFLKDMMKIDWDNVSKFNCLLPKGLQVRVAFDRRYDLVSALEEIKGMLEEDYLPDLHE